YWVEANGAGTDRSLKNSCRNCDDKFRTTEQFSILGTNLHLAFLPIDLLNAAISDDFHSVLPALICQVVDQRNISIGNAIVLCFLRSPFDMQSFYSRDV